MWIAGKRHTEETIRKMRLKKLGKKQTEATKRKLSLMRIGKKNPFYGKHHSSKSKQKIIENHRDVSNELNPVWKGKKAGYTAVHHWVERHKEKPVLCEHCDLYKPCDLANVSGEYRRDVDDYVWLCRSCHMRFDGRTFNLNGGKQTENANPIEEAYN